MIKRKPKRRYRLTAKKGITRKIYIPPGHHKKLPPVVKIYTKEEIQRLADKMGLEVSKNVK